MYFNDQENGHHDPTNDLVNHKALLSRIFGFTWQELNLNRSGEISADQREFIDEMRQRLYNPRVLLVGMVLAVLGFAASIAGYILSVEGIGPLLLGIVLSALPFGLFMFTVQAIRVNARNLREGQVTFVEGEAQPRTLRLFRGQPTYTVKIGTRRFIVRAPEQQDVFAPDRVYRAYFVFNWPVHILLSVEPVE